MFKQLVCVRQLKTCSTSFKQLEDKYQELFQTLFDADSSTLGNLDLYLLWHNI